MLTPSPSEAEPLFAAANGTASATHDWETPVPEPIPPLFQFKRTYIAFEHADGLVLIDQHSAHERVLYEQFMRMLETGSAPAQRLLLPITLHLGPAEGDAFEANREYLEKLGFEVEGFGGNTLIVNSVPMPHARFDAERCLRETLDALTGDRVAGTATRHEHLAATVACKAAIKAGEELSPAEMRSLFASLRDTSFRRTTFTAGPRSCSSRGTSSTGALAGDSIRVICGPTAAGKSGIALRLALEYGATIISADSRQIYRGFDIGTAKPSPSEMRTVPHRGIDVAEPTERYSASRWATAANEWIVEAEVERRTPLIVGGTGFYIRALFEPLFDAPPVEANRRAELEHWMDDLTLEDLRSLCGLDPEKAHLGRVQLSRAVETALLSGRRLSELQKQPARARAGVRSITPHYLVVDPAEKLAGNIERRVDAMLEGGWIDEVTSLTAHVPDDAPAWKASGYREVRDLADGSMDLSSARARIIIETRQYAKRQRTWLRHQLGAGSVTRVDPDDPDCAAAVERWWKELT